jgi:hypothetical protein
MSLTQVEFESLLADRTKEIQGDIQWAEDEDHSPSVEFRAEVTTTQGYPVFVRGSYNGLAGTLTFALIHREVGRIYALDMGKDHHNPSCTYVGEVHKHRFSDVYRDKEAYVPQDITESVLMPVAVWAQFCVEAGIVHKGVLQPPPPVQEELLP